MNPIKWINHFEHNRLNRPEPDWRAPVTLSRELLAQLMPSLQQFHLGDGGGPGCLIANDAERFRSATPEMTTLVDLWFAEEHEHSRLLGCAVRRFGGRPIESHWSFTAFCFCRRVLGIRFELLVLLLTEIVSTGYYRVLRRHADDAAIKAMCSLILRDEAGHVAFHRDRLASAGRTVRGFRGLLWRLKFRLLGNAAATMLWANHGKCLKPLGATTPEFYREANLELGRFLSRLDRSVEWSPAVRIRVTPAGTAA